MTSHKYIDDYLKAYDQGLILLNKDRIALVEFVRNAVIVRDDIWFDDKQISNFVAFGEKWFFPLEDWQKFLACFLFLFYDNGSLVFDQHFWTLARGNGKNGFISVISAYFLSPLHNVTQYNGAIVANSELQAKTSFEEIFNMIELNPDLKYSKTQNPQGAFKNSRSQILGVGTMSKLEYLTSNANTKDSFRHGFLIFDEVHQYENNDIINVLRSGLGKVQPDRTFYISTNGYIRDGVYDQMLRQARDILETGDIESGLFPFLCMLDDKEEAEDETMWEKANPMFHKPMSEYAVGLFRKIQSDWRNVQKGMGDKVEFLTKRMNISDVVLESSVASKEEVYATNREIPDITGMDCVAGLDYASMRDFAAIGLLFKKDEEFVWLSHSFIRKGFLDDVALAISSQIPQWEGQGLLTVIDEPSIPISKISEWLLMMEEKHNLNIITVVGDTYRAEYVREDLEMNGYNVDIIRRGNAISASVAPQIEVLFAREQLIYGDNPLMRWYTNNVYVGRDNFGNMIYQKKEEKRRKTDGFMAFVHAYWQAIELLDDPVEEFMFDGYVF